MSVTVGIRSAACRTVSAADQRNPLTVPPITTPRHAAEIPGDAARTAPLLGNGRLARSAALASCQISASVEGGTSASTACRQQHYRQLRTVVS